MINHSEIQRHRREIKQLNRATMFKHMLWQGIHGWIGQWSA